MDQAGSLGLPGGSSDACHRGPRRRQHLRFGPHPGGGEGRRPAPFQGCPVRYARAARQTRRLGEGEESACQGACFPGCPVRTRRQARRPGCGPGGRYQDRRASPARKAGARGGSRHRCRGAGQIHGRRGTHQQGRLVRDAPRACDHTGRGASHTCRAAGARTAARAHSGPGGRAGGAQGSGIGSTHPWLFPGRGGPYQHLPHPLVQGLGPAGTGHQRQPGGWHAVEAEWPAGPDRPV